MKQLFTFLSLTLLIVCTFFIQSSFAAIYPLSVTISDTALTATMTGVPATTDQYRLQVSKAPFSTVPAQNTPNLVTVGTASDFTKKATAGTVSWEISGLNPNATYYIRVLKLATTDTVIDDVVTTTQTLTNAANTTAPLLKTFVVSPVSGQEVKVSGILDTTSYVNVNTVEVQFFWSATASFEGSDPSDRRQESTGKNGQQAVFADGSYQMNISSLSPGAKYFFKQAIVTKTTGAVLESKFGTFDTANGFVPDGSVKQQELFDSQSYHLLAPWPGLSVLMDPDLCAQMKEGPNPKLPANAICDVNGFLNFAFKLLIGLTAVVLVLRLMFEGYQYVVTDVPFLKASAKSGFFTALTGLLLALSAYVILNTINPKLVDNRINISNVDVGVDQELALEQAGYDAQSAKNLSPDDIKKIVISYQGKYKYIQDEYIPARDKALPNESKGIKILMTAHTGMEGFYPTTKSYRTKNPGNIGNTDAAPQNWDCNSVGIKCYPTLEDGIARQYEHFKGIVDGTNPYYKIGKNYPSLGEVYNGSLYQYLKIYSTGARQSNTYLSYVISYFKKEGYTITGYTKMSEIANL